MQLKSTGKEQKFSTGAVRDANDDKACLELISPWAEERLGHWLRLGAQRYARRNWEAGIPMERTFASLKRHVNKYQMGMKDEDHLAAIMCNAMFLMHTETMIERGVLPKELDNMPRYEPRKQ